MAEEGWTGVDRWVTASRNSTISEQTVRLTDKGKCSAFGEAVVGAGRAEWDLTIEFESFGGISIGIYRQDLRDRDNINALPTDETFTYTPNGYGYANKTGAFTFNRERKKYGQRYRHGDKITVRLDLQSRSLTFLINDETQGLAYDGLPKGAYRLATCMQFKEQKVSIQRFWTSLGKKGTIPKLKSTKTVTSPKDKIGKKHETFNQDIDDYVYDKKPLSPVEKKQKAAKLYADYKEPVLDPDADMFGDDYNSDNEESDDVYVPEDSDDDNDNDNNEDQKLNDELDALENLSSEEEEFEEHKRPARSPHNHITTEVDTVGLIGGRSRGLSKADNKVPEPLSIESVDEDATDYFSVSGSNLKTARSTVTCTRSNANGSVHSALGTQLVARGRIEWMIHVDIGHSIRIGVCGSTKDATDRIFTETKYGYGYGDDGNIYFGGSHIEYNDGFKAGDIIGVYLNMDMNTLKFSVNGSDHGAAFDSIELSEKDNINGYRLAVSLRHRPHKLTLLESTLYNVERRSPRPNSNQFNINSSKSSGHQRKLSYNMTKNNNNNKGSAKTKAKTKTKTKIKNNEKEKKSNKKKKNNKKTDKIKKEKNKGGKKKKIKKEDSPSKKKGKKNKGKKKTKKSKKTEDNEEKKEEKRTNNWVKREQTNKKDKWGGCGSKLVIEKSSVSTKTNIKDGNSAFGKLICKGNKMKCKWDITIKQGDNICVGICNVVGGLKTNKNKKLLIQSFTNDINGYGYMGNDGGIQRSGRYKKYGQKFKAGDKVSIVLDMNAKKLSFILNGQDQGVAFKNLPSGEYRVAASFFEKSQKITLNKTTLWDISK